MIALISQAQLGNLRCTPQSYNMCEPSPPHKSQPRRQAHAAARATGVRGGPIGPQPTETSACTPGLRGGCGWEAAPKEPCALLPQLCPTAGVGQAGSLHGWIVSIIM